MTAASSGSFGAASAGPNTADRGLRAAFRSTLPLRRNLADALAAAVAASLPWSTSATLILIGAWLAVLLPTLTRADLRVVLSHPAGVLPALLWTAALAGTLWAGVAWAERLEGLSSFSRLLAIPLLVAQFRRSPRAHWVIGGFLAGAGALLAASYLLAFWPGLTWRGHQPGVPVKDYITQSGLFALAACILAEITVALARARRIGLATLSGAGSLLFLGNMVFIATGRTALVALPFMAIVLAARHGGVRGIVAILLAGALLAAGAWAASPYLQQRVAGVAQELREYRQGETLSSSGLRLEFWRKSISFVTDAPVLGHGTGAIADLFRRSAVAQSGYAGARADNPHNQYLTVAIQLGALGTFLLLAMWGAQARLFTPPGPLGTIGLVVVTQVVVSSLFNSTLFDFTSGWTYVFVSGTLAGAVSGGAETGPRSALARASPRDAGSASR